MEEFTNQEDIEQAIKFRFSQLSIHGVSLDFSCYHDGIFNYSVKVHVGCDSNMFEREITISIISDDYFMAKENVHTLLMAKNVSYLEYKEVVNHDNLEEFSSVDYNYVYRPLLEANRQADLN